MNHRNARTYQAYINENVQIDVQSVFLGRPSAQATMNEFGTMGRRRDPMAPTDLTEAEGETLKRHPSISKLKDEVSLVRERLNDTNIVTHEAEWEALKRRKVDLSAEVHRVRVALYWDAKRLKRKEYFDIVDEKEIARQLSRSGQEDEEEDDEDEDRKPVPVEHQLPERQAVVECLFDVPSTLDEGAAFERRKQAMLAIEALCRRREPPRAISHRLDQQKVVRSTVTVSEAPLVPYICTSLCCLFCMGITTMSFTERIQQFKSTYSAQRHTRWWHLSCVNENDPIECPHPACHVTLDNVMHFKHHAADQHWCFL